MHFFSLFPFKNSWVIKEQQRIPRINFFTSNCCQIIEETKVFKINHVLSQDYFMSNLVKFQVEKTKQYKIYNILNESIIFNC